MANFKKIDDLDLVFVNKTLNEKEEKAFSEFLKKRRTSQKGRSRISVRKSPKIPA